MSKLRNFCEKEYEKFKNYIGYKQKNRIFAIGILRILIGMFLEKFELFSCFDISLIV